MGFGTVGNVASIHSYKMADEYFNSRKEHKRCKNWQSDERCLKKRASGNRHYRLEQGFNADYYDVCLYSTVMARFYKPDENGHRRVLYAGHNSITSSSFQQSVLGIWSAMRRTTTAGKEVIVPLYCNNVFHDKSDKFCTDLLFTSDGLLITDKSKHAPHYTHKSNDEDKARRKRIKAKFSNLIMLAQMRMPEFADNCTPTHDKGRPFGGGHTSYNERMAVESIWEGGDDLEQHWIDHFFDLCQEVYDTLVAKRGYDQSNFSLGYRYAQPNQTFSTPSDLEKPITEKCLEKAILNKVFRLVGANGGSEAVAQPQFMEVGDYPRTTITTWA
jgi:hypothetical protein